MSNKRGWIVALIAALVLLVAFTGFEVISYRPSFCARCHRSEYSYWSRSKHSDSTCYDCHGSTRSLSWITNKFNEYYMVVAQLTGRFREPITAFVDNGNCMACHKGIVDNPVVAAFGIRMRHSDVISAGIRCTSCHNTVAHGKATRNPTAPYMETCTPCHDGEKAPATCGTCHYKREERLPTERVAPWAVTHGEKWTKTHGMGNLRTCVICHPARKCVACHGMVIPHPAGWPMNHGKAAVGNLIAVSGPDKPRSCVGCHARSFCDGCHRLAMPHPSGFLRIHSRQYKRLGRTACESCHVLSDCDECHQKHVHPGKLRDPFLKKPATPKRKG